MDIFGKTDIGKLREVNQDNFSYEKFDDNLCFAFVCDGMGGTNGGNVASEIATEVLSKSFCKNLKLDFNSDQIRQVIESAFKLANSEILKCANSDPKLVGMGTTVVGLILLENILHVFNIGDSRAYLFDGDRMQQLTVDHSYVQTLVDCGEITPDEARVHPRKNEITKAMGIREKIDYDFHIINVQTGDYLLLCSDGLTNVCSEDEIKDILNEQKGVKQGVIKLIDIANENGGYDNITVVLVKI